MDSQIVQNNGSVVSTDSTIEERLARMEERQIRSEEREIRSEEREIRMESMLQALCQRTEGAPAVASAKTPSKKAKAQKLTTEDRRQKLLDLQERLKSPTMELETPVRFWEGRAGKSRLYFAEDNSFLYYDDWGHLYADWKECYDPKYTQPLRREDSAAHRILTTHKLK